MMLLYTKHGVVRVSDTYLISTLCGYSQWRIQDPESKGTDFFNMRVCIKFLCSNFSLYFSVYLNYKIYIIFYLTY